MSPELYPLHPDFGILLELRKTLDLSICIWSPTLAISQHRRIRLTRRFPWLSKITTTISAIIPWSLLMPKLGVWSRIVKTFAVGRSLHTPALYCLSGLFSISQRSSDNYRNVSHFSAKLNTFSTLIGSTDPNRFLRWFIGTIQTPTSSEMRSKDWLGNDN